MSQQVQFGDRVLEDSERADGLQSTSMLKSKKKSVLEPSNVVVKEYLSNRVNKFPWESGGKEEESQSFFPLCLYV